MTKRRGLVLSRRRARGAGVCFALVLALGVSACDGMSGTTSETSTGHASSDIGSSQPGGTGGARGTGGSVDNGQSSGPAPAPYAFTGAGMLTDVTRRAKPLVYVPNQLSGTMEVIDPRTYRVIAHYRVPASPEHVVPSWDFTRLWVISDQGNALTPIDPTTGRPGTSVVVRDPYNLYFTPDGAHALVMASKERAIDVLDPHTMARQRSLSVPECAGVNHADFSADLSVLVTSCEFNGRLLVVDSEATRVLKVIDLNGIRTPGATSPEQARGLGGPKNALAKGASAMPQDVRLTPDGAWFMVADMLRNGAWFISTRTLDFDHFVPTGKGAHGIYPSRDAKRVFVSNRDEGTISVFGATTDAPTAKWRLPAHATPDMGGVTADGTQLWLSGRYSAEVYVIDAETGRLLQRIRTDAGPHGLLVWPQPGRFALGHTGNTR